MKKNIVIAIAVLFVVSVGVFLWKSQTRTEETVTNSPEKIRVMASFYPLAFLASRIGGDVAEVSVLTPAGAEPHDYEPTPRQMADLEKSRLIILNGGHLEAWGENIGQNIDPARTTVVVAGEGLMTKTVEEEGETIIDPHVWLSPVLALRMTEIIASGFVQADPSHADVYRANAESLKNQLEDVDALYRRGLADCAKRDMITSHAAFGYLASEYGLNQVSIAGLSPEAEPSSQELAAITEFARAHDTKYIFFESLVSPKLSETLAREVGAQTSVLNPIEGLTGEELSAGKDYLTEMRTNLDQLRTALQCK